MRRWYSVKPDRSSDQVPGRHFFGGYPELERHQLIQHVVFTTDTGRVAVDIEGPAHTHYQRVHGECYFPFSFIVLATSVILH